jgi:MoaA/NifB/PqqE/SkfB family radical SAM enzyme
MRLNKKKNLHNFIFRNKVLNHLMYFDFVYRQPVILLRLLGNYFQQIFFRQQRLRIADIALTFDCNANCEHCCSAAMRNDNRKPLSIEEIHSVIRQAVDLGAVIFNFLGGEPLVDRNIYEAIKYVKSCRAVAGISTNGLLLTEDVVAKLKAAGLDVAQVDVESINPEELDLIRKYKGCYNKILDGIQRLKNAGIKVIMSTILTKKNVANGDIHKIVDLAKELNVVINVNCSAKVGNWAHQEESLLSPEEYNVFCQIMKLAHTRWAGSTNYWGEYCPCGTEKIFITAYGDLLPCGLISVSYGNIREKPLKPLWQKMYQQNVSKRRSSGCRAAFDAEIVDLNHKLYAKKQPLPVAIEAVENK